MKQVVNFINVGRSNASWSAIFENGANEENIYDHLLARKPRPFGSRFIEVYVDDEGKTGRIYAGFHTIGTFQINEAQP